MAGVNISCQILSGGQSSKLAVTAASIQSAALISSSYLVTPSVNMFVRTGLNPVAVADGTDQYLVAGSTYRIVPLRPGDKLAFIAESTAGNVFLTPDA